MRILHTSDWHVGKTLRGASRLDEHKAVLAEITDIAAMEHVDVVLVTGDLFESAAPPPDAQRVVWDALLGLRATGAHVVAIGGNHDNQFALDAIAPVFAAAGVTLLGHATRPDKGGVIELDARGEKAVVVLLPWVSQRFAIRAEQLLALDAAEAAGLYAERIRLLVAALSERLRPDTVNLVAAHCFVHGGTLGGGERGAQTIFDYGIDALCFPAQANYVALGHLHRTQRMPARAPAWYAGSPIQVDFGEEHDDKHVLLVDAAPGVPARVERRLLATPSQLRTLRGSFEELRSAADEIGDAWLRVYVREAARAGLADEVRALLPRAVDVRIERAEAPPADVRSHVARSRSPRDLFRAYLTSEGIDDPRAERLFGQLYDEAMAEAAG
jgi:DNA repair protein SbcD/Mre11